MVNQDINGVMSENAIPAEMQKNKQLNKALR